MSQKEHTSTVESDFWQESARQRWPQLLLLIGAALYLWLNLFASLHIPFLLEGDQTWFRANALRMLHGEKIYHDFFQFTPPGTDVFHLTLLKFFGLHMWVMNVAVLLVGVALCWLCFSIAKLMMEQKLAVLATALFLVLVYTRLLDATHHWFSLLAVLCAVRILMPGNTPARIVAAGALLGLASFFTQTTGASCAVALLLFLIWEGRSTGKLWRRIVGSQLVLVLAFAATISMLCAYFIAESGWKPICYMLITYPQHFVAYGDHRFFPRISQLPNLRGLPDLVAYLFLYALMLVIYPAVLWHCWHRRNNLAIRERAQLVLVSLVGLAVVLEMITRVNRVRIFSVSMPALILLFWVIAHARKRQAFLVTAGWIIVACFAVQQTALRYRQYQEIANLPSGKAALTAERYEHFSWLMEHTKPGDLFFQSSWPNVYFPLDLRSPAFVDGLTTNEVTRPEWVDLTIRQVEDKQVKYILCSPWLYRQFDPRHPWEDHLEPFRTYLRSHYTRVHVFSDQDEIWERN